MNRIQTVELENRSHAVMLEANCNLFKIIKDEGFYIKERILSSNKPWKGSMINNFGTPGPIELPPKEELEKIKPLTEPLRSNFSPVYFTTARDGRIVKELSQFPEARPVLLIGNHQLLAPDTFLLIEEFVREKGILVRGLTVPSLLQDLRLEKGKEEEFFSVQGDPRDLKRILTTYGGVANGSRSLYNLLSQNEVVLLYPGGVREAYKKKNEEYKIIWPDRAEFIRTAIKFGATIVTVASIGADESFNIILDHDEMLKLPVIGDLVKKQSERVPNPRRGVAEDNADKQIFFQPIGVPTLPKRIYTLLGKPIDTSGEDYKDKKRCEELYKEVREVLQKDIALLIEKREEDPYKDFIQRRIYETSWSGKQAPTFEF